MPEDTILYFGDAAKVRCDGNCEKAWGLHSRPKTQLSENEDDYAFLADDELGMAPADPGTYEGGYGKPASATHFPNKWCVRECERLAMSRPGKIESGLILPNLSQRLYNIPHLHEERKGANATNPIQHRN
jgi:hypothetical protein